MLELKRLNQLKMHIQIKRDGAIHANKKTEHFATLQN